MQKVLVTFLFLLNSSSSVTAPTTPIPEFYGVYAVVEDRLIELRANSFDLSAQGIALGGLDLITGLSEVELDHGDVQFIIYAQGAGAAMRIPVARIARVAEEITRSSWTPGSGRVSERDAIAARWHLLDRGIELRLAPVPDQTSMVRAVPSEALRRGIWGLLFNGRLYDFRIGPDADQAADCVVREVHFTGVSYRSCTDSHVDLRRADRSERHDAPLEEEDYVAEATESFNVPREVLWQAVLDFLKKQKDRVAQVSEEDGTITTYYSIHGGLLSKRSEKYSILVAADGERSKLLLKAWTRSSYSVEGDNTLRFRGDSSASERSAKRFVKNLRRYLKK